MTGILLVAFALFNLVPVPDPSEPRPVPLLPDCGPVIDHAEAAQLGLFRYRQNFGALRFVRADSGFEARIATSVGGVMLEQAVPLDSTMLSRVEQGLVMLRDRSATNVELLLSPRYPLDASCLSPTTEARARAGAACFGLLGIGVGSTIAMHTVVDYPARYSYGEPKWNRAAYLVISTVGGLLGGTGGWTHGSHSDAARPVQPRPRCAIAGYDDNGYPIYEEQVRAVLGAQSTVHFTFGALAVAGAASVFVSNAILTSYRDRGNYYSGFANQFPAFTAAFGTLATGAFVGNTIGRDMDRRVAIEKLRNRPKPEPVRPLHALPPPAFEE